MSDESDEIIVRTPPKKRTYQQGYRTAWEKEDQFKNWLTQSKKGELYFYCKTCNFNGKGGKSEIGKHASTGNHKKLCASSKNQQTLFSMPSISNATSLDNDVKQGILYDRLESQYKLLLKNYIKPLYLEKTLVENVQFKNPNNYLDNDLIYLGGKIHAYVDRCGISGQTKKEFTNNCLLFYVEAATQIYKRFPLQ